MNIKSLKSRIARKMLSYSMEYLNREEARSYEEEIAMKLSKLPCRKELTKEQEQEIQDFYKPLLGHKVSLDWHRYFLSRKGEYSKLYLPNVEWKTNIVGRLNVYPLKRAYADKNIIDLILPETRQPKIIMKNMNGYYYFDRKAVTKEEACELCKDIGDVIIKPSLRSRGFGVLKMCVKDGFVDGEMPLSKLFDEYKRDFLIEELVNQHPKMAALNPTSVNTIRLVTYRSDMNVNLVYSVIRIGRSGQAIDNESAGGISTVINLDGTLGKYAFGAPGQDRIENTDNGIRLEGYCIPSYQKAVEMVKEAHLQLPFFDFIGWDIAIEEDGNPTMIEFNMTPDLSQSANGPALGEYTTMILKDAMSRKNTYSKTVDDCMWMRNKLFN